MAREKCGRVRETRVGETMRSRQDLTVRGC